MTALVSPDKGPQSAGEGVASPPLGRRAAFAPAVRCVWDHQRRERAPRGAGHHTLRRRWGDRLPAAGALLHIGIIALGVVAIVPERWSRLDRDVRGWSDDDRLGPIRVPVRRPVRPDGHPKARPEEAMRAMPKAMGAMPKAMPAVPPMPAAVSTPPRVPWHRARHEQQDQQPEQHHPRRSRACGLIRVAHRAPLPPSPVCWPWKTPRPLVPSPVTRWQKTRARRPLRGAAACPWARGASAFGSVRVGSGMPVCLWGAAVRPSGWGYSRASIDRSLLIFYGLQIAPAMGEHDLHTPLSSAWFKRDRPYGPFLVCGSALCSSPTDHPGIPHR